VFLSFSSEQLSRQVSVALQYANSNNNDDDDNNNNNNNNKA
jgi:hypothetical protein